LRVDARFARLKSTERSRFATKAIGCAAISFVSV
jgi:hypothetical protein